MGGSKSLLRRIGKWSLKLVIALVLLFAFQVAVLAFPQIVLSNSVTFGTVVLYYDSGDAGEMAKLAAEVDMRLRGSELYDSTRTDRVFFFQDQSWYMFYARLTFVPIEAQGYNISILRNTFVDAQRIRALGEWTGGLPEYSIWEGSYAHTIAHEIAHQYIIDNIGRSTWMNLPHWKREGLPEYVANIGAMRRDGAATLPSRIAILDNEQIWSNTWSSDRQNWDRLHYEAGLLVEFLLDVRGYTLEEVIDDSVTKSETMISMKAWCEAQKSDLKL